MISWGMVFIFLLPPFEGRDEIFHYSSIRQISHDLTVPLVGHSFIDKEVLRYSMIGPMPYRVDIPEIPMGPHSYHSFSNSLGLQHTYINEVSTFLSSRSPYMASDKVNVASQHPPLYYLLMAPIAWITIGLPLHHEIYIFRLTSYFFALLGFLFIYKAVKNKFNQSVANISLLLMVMVNLVLPQSMLEFTKIGNDALLTMFIAMLLWAISKERNLYECIQRPRLIGVLCGAAFLTKFMFIPVFMGLLSVLLLENYQQKNDELIFFNQLKKIKQMTVYALSPIFIWLFITYLYLGHVNFSEEQVRLNQIGGLWMNLQNQFDVGKLLKITYMSIGSFVWSGSWSIFSNQTIQIFGFLIAIPLIFSIGRMSLLLSKKHKLFLLVTTFIFLTMFVVHSLTSIALGTHLWPRYGLYLLILQPLVIWMLIQHLGSISKLNILHIGISVFIANLLLVAHSYYVFMGSENISNFIRLVLNSNYQSPHINESMVIVPIIFSAVAFVSLLMKCQDDFRAYFNNSSTQ